MLIPTLLIHHWGKPVATPARTTTPVPNVVVPKTEPKLKASGPPRKQVGTASMPKASAVGPIPTSSAKSTPVKSPEMKRLRKVKLIPLTLMVQSRTCPMTLMGPWKWSHQLLPTVRRILFLSNIILDQHCFNLQQATSCDPNLLPFCPVQMPVILRLFRQLCHLAPMCGTSLTLLLMMWVELVPGSD